MNMEEIKRNVPLLPVQFAAGFRLLDKFKSQWVELHIASETNVHKSQSVMTRLSAIEQQCSHQLDAFESFSKSYRSISELEEQITNIHNDLSNLELSFVKIEECLNILKQAKEQRDADHFVRNCKGNLQAQIQRTKIQSEIRRDQLMSEHLQRVQSSTMKDEQDN